MNAQKNNPRYATFTRRLAKIADTATQMRAPSKDLWLMSQWQHHPRVNACCYRLLLA